MRVPWPGGLCTSKSPSSASTRSRRPPSPEPSLGVAPPQPSSVTSMTSTASRGITRTVADVARAYLSTFVSASETTKYAALSTSGDHRSTSSTVMTVTGIGARLASECGVEVQVNLFELRGGKRFAVDTVGAVAPAGQWQRLDVSHDSHRPGAVLAVEILAPTLKRGTALLVDDLAVRASSSPM